MTADFMNSLHTLTAASPVIAGGMIFGCGMLFMFTRAPEFLMMTAICALYATAAVLPLHA